MNKDQLKLANDAKIETAVNAVFKSFLREADEQAMIIFNEYKRKKDAWHLTEVTYRTEGELDFDLITNYKTNGDIFSQLAMKRKGKSHSINLFIDFSGSMQSVISDVIMQAIVIARFAQRANIPYQMFIQGYRGYNNSGRELFRAGEHDALKLTANSIKRIASSEHSKSRQDFMLKVLFSQALVHLQRCPTHLRPSYDLVHQAAGTDQRFKEICGQFSMLGSTLLLEGIYAMAQAIRDFNARNKVQNSTVMFLTDGQDNEGIQCSSVNGVFSHHGGSMSGDALEASVVYDRTTGGTWRMIDLLPSDVKTIAAQSGNYNAYAVQLSVALGYLKQVTGSKIAGIYLGNNQTMGQMFRGFTCYNANDIMKAKLDNHFASNVEGNNGKYAKFEGLVGYDIATLVNTDILAGVFKTLNLDAGKNGTQINAGVKSSGGAVNMNVLKSNIIAQANERKIVRLLALDFADLICRDFEVKKKIRKTWTEGVPRRAATQSVDKLMA